MGKHGYSIESGDLALHYRGSAGMGQSAVRASNKKEKRQVVDQHSERTFKPLEKRKKNARPDASKQVQHTHRLEEPLRPIV